MTGTNLKGWLREWHSGNHCYSSLVITSVTLCSPLAFWLTGHVNTVWLQSAWYFKLVGNKSIVAKGFWFHNHTSLLSEAFFPFCFFCENFSVECHFCCLICVCKLEACWTFSKVIFNRFLYFSTLERNQIAVWQSSGSPTLWPLSKHCISPSLSKIAVYIHNILTLINTAILFTYLNKYHALFMCFSVKWTVIKILLGPDLFQSQVLSTF